MAKSGGSAGREGRAASAEHQKALDEFRFLESRLAAGHLKRGERRMINRRREELAKTVLGVNNG